MCAQRERAVGAKIGVANALEREWVRPLRSELRIESERALLEVIAEIRDSMLLGAMTTRPVVEITGLGEVTSTLDDSS
jgi:hypothetical protein